MQQIKDVKSYPNGTPIEAIQAKVAQVYEYRNVDTKFGKKTAQSIVLEDGGGNKIRATLWEHPNLEGHEGKEYVFSGGKGGKGIQVKHDSYIPKGGTEADRKTTVELSVGKAGQLQIVEVYHQYNPGTKPADAQQRSSEAVPSPAKAPNPSQGGQDRGVEVKSPYTPINGAKVGMALNNAVLLLTAPKLVSMDDIKQMAIEIIRVSNDLESGRIQIEKPTEEQKAANLVDKKTGQPVPDEDVTY